jgi:4'-phosphopantetheinyl transferase
MSALITHGMANLECWVPNPEQLELGDDEIHVWRVYLNCEGTELDQFESTFKSDEKVRANRFLHRRDRNAFVATRGVLRELLGRYLGCPPTDLEFDYGRYGKPFLREGLFKRSVQFNVSHSHGLALLAFTVGRSLGVDVEFVRPNFAAYEIAERYFSPLEFLELRALPLSLRAEGFFLGWTRKEAYVKAKGEGLQLPFQRFHVSLTPGQPVRLENGDSFQWSLRSLCPDPRYAGALVGEGRGWRPRFWDWKPADPCLME